MMLAPARHKSNVIERHAIAGSNLRISARGELAQLFHDLFQSLPGDFGTDHGRVALARRGRKYANSILRLHVFRLHCFCAWQVLASYRSVILRDGLLETLCSTPSWRGAFFLPPCSVAFQAAHDPIPGGMLPLRIHRLRRVDNVPSSP